MSGGSSSDDADGPVRVRRVNGRWRVVGELGQERYCVASCPIPFADIDEYDGLMLKCSGVCGRW